MNNVTSLAIDLAKNVFQLHGTNERGKAILIESAYPFDPAEKKRGLAYTRWRPIIKSEYDKCLDNREYRPKHLLK